MDKKIKNEILEYLKAIEDLVNETPKTEVKQTSVMLRDLPQGSVFVFQDNEFIKLGDEQGGVLCITRNFWAKDEEFGNDADYKSSRIKEMLERDFWNDKDDDKILPYTMDLTSDNGDKVLGSYTSKIGLLTCDLYRKYYYQIPRYDDWWWTCTAWGYSSGAYYVRGVNLDGSLYSSYADYSGGVVPACILDGQTLISCDSNCEGKDD